MPGEPRKRGKVGGARLDQRFCGGDDFDQRTIVKQQQIVGAQSRRLMQIDVDRRALDAGDTRLAAALGELENDGVGDRPLMAVRCVDDANGARHRIF